MTPSDIEVLIHCHGVATVHPRIKAPAVEEAIKMFLKNDLIIGTGPDYYETTTKGMYLIKMLCGTPFPISEYSDPRENEKH